MNSIVGPILFALLFGVFALLALTSTILCRVCACRHDRVAIVRAHPESGFGLEHKGKHAWVDVHGVLNFVQCRSCKKVLEAKTTERIYSTMDDSAALAKAEAA